MNIQLSLIIPNYNNGKYLRDCLDSVLNQTYIPHEVIIADDASTDNSVEIIQQYEAQNDFIFGIYHKSNNGVSFNRHHAILKARGNYITTLDSDDYFYSNEKLENEIKLIQTYKILYDKDIIPYSNVVLTLKNRCKIGNVYNSNNIIECNILVSIMSRTNPNPLDYIVNKKYYLAVGGYNTQIPLYEDWDLSIKLASKYEFYFTGEVGTAYRMHSEGLSSSKFIDHIKWQSKIFYQNRNLLCFKKRLYVGMKLILLFFKQFVSRILRRNSLLLCILKKIKYSIFNKA